MKTFLKWVGIALAALVLVVVAAIVIVPLVFDPNDYRQNVADAIAEQTGRPVTIEGNLALTVFPWLGVDAGRMSLGQPPELSGLPFPPDTPFVQSERIQVRVKLLPLITGQVEMDTVSIEGLSANFARLADGRDNWTDLTQRPASDREGPPPVAALAIGGLAVRQAMVRIYDERAGARIDLRNIKLTTGAVDLEQPAPVDINATLDAHATGPAVPDGDLRAAVTLRSAVSFTGPQAPLTLGDLAAATELTFASGEKLRTDLTGEASYDLASGATRTSGLQIGVKSDAFQGGSFDTRTAITDGLIGPGGRAFEAATVRTSGTLGGAFAGGGNVGYEATATPQVDLDQGTWRLADLSLSAPKFASAGAAGAVTLRANAVGNLNTGTVQIRQLDADAKLAGEALAGGKVEVQTRGDLDLDLTHRVASSPNLEIVSPAFELAGYAGSLRATTALNADPNRQRFTAKGLAADGTLSKGPGFTGPLPFLLRADLALDLVQGLLTSKTLRLESSAFDVDAAKGEFSLDLTDATVSLTEQRLNAQALRARSRVSGKAAFTGNADIDVRGSAVSASPDQVDIADLRLLAPSFDVNGNRGSVDARAKLGTKLSTNEVRLAGLQAKGKLAGTALAGGQTDYELRTDAHYRTDDGRFSLRRLTLALAGLEYQGFSGNLRTSGDLDGSPAAGRFKSPGLRVRGKLRGKQIPGRESDIDIKTGLDANLTADTLRLSELSARALGLHASGTVSVAQLTTGPSYEGDLALSPFKPRPLIKRLGLGSIKTADRKALSRVAARAKVAGNPSQISLSGLVLELDQSTARGNLTVRGLNPGPSRPYVRFDLSVNGIDADRYLPPPSKSKGRKGGGTSAALPLALLTQVDLDGQLKVGKLKANNVRMSNFKLAAKGKDGKLDFDPVSGNLYRGTVHAKGRINTQGKVPTLKVDKQFRGVQAGRLLTDLNGKAPVTGAADFDLALTTRGTTGNALLGNANGTTRFELRDGTIEGVNMVREICGKLSNFGVVTAKTGPSDQTAFSSLTGSGNIRKGVLYNEDMTMVSPFLRVVGKGNVQLVPQVVGYAVTAHLVDSCAGQGRGLVEDLVDIPIPVRVSGPMTNLRYGFDFDRLLASLARKQVHRKGARILEKALGRTPSEGTESGSSGGSVPEKVIDGLLKGLFK